MRTIPAIKQHDTKVIDPGSWDGPKEEAKMSNDAGEATLRKMYAWVDPKKDADTKAAYKFPHHQVVDGEPGAAVVSALRIGLARIKVAKVPESDKAGIRRHLEHHLNAWRKQNEGNANGANLMWATAVVGKAWAVRAEVMAIIQAALAAGEQPNMALGQVDLEEPADNESGVAVIPLHGLITPHGSFLSLFFGMGGGGLDNFRSQLASAVEDENVDHIVIDVDSPGGLVDLVPETAAEVRAARDIKPITAIANTTAASAAYWIASQASEFVVTPSGEVGSIGVYSMHTDISKLQENMGVNTSLISAGKYKVEGNPYEPLSSTARKAIQDDIDEIYDMFVADVALGRNAPERSVRSGYGEGRTVLAQNAVQAGMADRVATLDSVLAGIVPASTDSATNASAEDGGLDRAALAYMLFS